MMIAQPLQLSDSQDKGRVPPYPERECQPGLQHEVMISDPPVDRPLDHAIGHGTALSSVLLFVMDQALYTKACEVTCKNKDL